MLVQTLPPDRVAAGDSESSESDVVHDHIRLRQHQIGSIAGIAVRIGARHTQHPGTTDSRETVSGSSCSGELSSGGSSTKMISDGCPYANRKVFIKRVGENLLPTA